MKKSPRGWYHRGYLPHYDPGSITQFITCRLYDSLPQTVLRRLEAELECRPVENIQRKKLILIDKFLDIGYGQCFLGQEEIATVVRDSMLTFHGERYELISWVIMPNHIHVLLRPFDGFALEKIIHSFKSFTSLKANRILGRTGTFWMREYFDRYIRDSDHFEKAIRYIENNPVKAGLCKTPEDWRFSSAYKLG